MAKEICKIPNSATYRPFEPHDEHVLRQPALPLGERGPDAEGEALLAEERVAAVA